MTEFYKKFYGMHLHIDSQYFGVIHPYLDINFSTNEIFRVLNSAKNNKSPGVDNISNEFFKNLPLDFIIHLKAFFNNILNEEQISPTWTDVKMIHFHKSVDIKNPNNYRSMALLNHKTKLFTQLINTRLTYFVENNEILPECQSGFRRTRNCEDNIFVLYAIINNYLRLPSRKLYTLFVDFRKAFDSLDHHILWEKLYSNGISAKITRILKIIYNQAALFIEQEGSSLERVQITKGVLQWDPLSPLLFAIFISDIDSYFQNQGSKGVTLDEGDNIRMLLYADDLVLFAESQIQMEKNLRILDSYCNKCKLQVNRKNKTSYIPKEPQLWKTTHVFIP